MLRHSRVYDRNHLPRHIVYHSPTGMNWGYGGSGPADLALSLLYAVVGKKKAFRLHQQFKSEIVSRFDDNWSIMASDIRAWVAEVDKNRCDWCGDFGGVFTAISPKGRKEQLCRGCVDVALAEAGYKSEEEK